MCILSNKVSNLFLGQQLDSTTMAFDASKREILHKLQQVIDKSPKGSVDAPIVDMIERLNAHPDYVGALIVRQTC